MGTDRGRGCKRSMDEINQVLYDVGEARLDGTHLTLEGTCHHCVEVCDGALCGIGESGESSELIRIW